MARPARSDPSRHPRLGRDCIESGEIIPLIPTIPVQFTTNRSDNVRGPNHRRQEGSSEHRVHSGVLRQPAVLPRLLGVGAMATVEQVFLTKAYRGGAPTKVSVVGLSQVVMVIAFEGLIDGRQFTAWQLVGTALVLGPTAYRMARAPPGEGQPAGGGDGVRVRLMRPAYGCRIAPSGEPPDGRRSLGVSYARKESLRRKFTSVRSAAVCSTELSTTRNDF